MPSSAPPSPFNLHHVHIPIQYVTFYLLFILPTWNETSTLAGACLFCSPLSPPWLIHRISPTNSCWRRWMNLSLSWVSIKVFQISCSFSVLDPEMNWAAGSPHSYVWISSQLSPVVVPLAFGFWWHLKLLWTARHRWRSGAGTWQWPWKHYDAVLSSPATLNRRCGYFRNNKWSTCHYVLEFLPGYWCWEIKIKENKGFIF